MDIFELKVSSNYFELCSNLIKCHGELMKKMQDEKVKGKIKQEVLVIFGKTRSGKSTFLSRLASDISSEEFKELISETTKHVGKIFTIEGIEVASGHKAVTMVPNFYVLSGRLIVDLAGFDDLTPERRPIISLLNFYLLSQIPNVKLLTLVTLESLMKGQMDTTVRSFYTHYENLLSKENVSKGLKSTLFLLSHIDLYTEIVCSDAKTEDLDKALFTTVGQYSLTLQSEDNPGLSQMASSMIVKKVFLDYSLKPDQILEHVDDVLKIMPAMNASLIKIDIQSVQNEIVAQCAQVTEEVYKFLNDLAEKNKNIQEQLKIKKKELCDIIEDFKTLKSMVTLNKDLKEKKQNLTLEISKKQSQMDGVKSRMSELKDELLEVEAQHLAMDEKKKDFVWPQVNAYGSINRDGTHKLYVDWRYPKGITGAPDLMIISFEDYTNVVIGKGYDDNPETIKDANIPDLRGDKKTNKNIIVSLLDGKVAIQSSLPISHIALIISSTNLNETPAVKFIFSHIEKKKNQINLGLLNLENQHSRFISEIFDLEEGVNKTNNEIKTNFESFSKSKSRNIDELNVLTNDLIKLEALCQQSVATICGVTTNQIFMVTVKVGQILKECNIGQNFLERLGDYQKETEKLIASYNELATQFSEQQLISFQSLSNSTNLFFD